jgi:DNA-binding NtrC family response regulator
MVMNREEMRRLRAILRPLGAAIDWAVDVDSAHVALDAPTIYDAVVVDDRLPEEGWQQVMTSAGALGVKAPFLVCTNLERADRFLTQSKKTFIADLLMRPYVDEIVQHRVQNALETDQTEPYRGATIPSHQ